MITHLLDSDWLADYLKGKDEAQELLRPLIEQGSLGTTIIVYGEIYEGLLDNPAKESLLRAIADVLEGVPLVGLDLETAHVFAGLRATLRSRGQLIPDHDLWIAATALRYDLTLISRDRHFERIPDLERR